MELRIILLLMRILDPRLWRRRLAQLAGASLVSAWIVGRAAARTEDVRIARDARWTVRRADLQAARTAEELRAHDRAFDELAGR